jgi:hypothetical protein
MSKPSRPLRPPPPPQNPSEYDGHENYRAAFAPKPPLETLQGVLVVPLIFLMWFAGGVFSYELLVGDRDNMGTVLVVGAFCWLILGPAVAIAYAVLAHRLRASLVLWLAAFALAVLLAFVAFDYW